MGILKEFYDGNIYPAEKIIPPDDKYRTLSTEISNGQNYFSNQLPDEDKERFHEWNSQIRTREEMMEYANFSYGFKLGVLLAFEIFTEQDNI